ncbi:hypothetical protein EDD18DRAFT_778028 [Armillaria luteobubalina]|uniref:Uncharacterized protein n=1 Tax=Armillaria luteobubalina TaxID=153913 RepID=A0AA39QD59_9AGAR|nr:hypothetical protein EDD18DRAFT_778028 [Armillaria luteobubalina]
MNAGIRSPGVNLKFTDRILVVGRTGCLGVGYKRVSEGHVIVAGLRCVGLGDRSERCWEGWHQVSCDDQLQMILAQRQPTSPTVHRSTAGLARAYLQGMRGRTPKAEKSLRGVIEDTNTIWSDGCLKIFCLPPPTTKRTYQWEQSASLVALKDGASWNTILRRLSCCTQYHSETMPLLVDPVLCRDRAFRLIVPTIFESTGDSFYIQLEHRK